MIFLLIGYNYHVTASVFTLGHELFQLAENQADKYSG